MWIRGEKEALAVSRGIRVSPRKLNSVARLLRGRSARASLNFLKLSSKLSVKEHLIKVVESAVANAENNHNLDVDALMVKEATVNKHGALKRIRPRARGRADKFIHPYSSVRIVLEEKLAVPEVRKVQKSAGPKQAKKKVSKPSNSPARKMKELSKRVVKDDGAKS